MSENAEEKPWYSSITDLMPDWLSGAGDWFKDGSITETFSNASKGDMPIWQKILGIGGGGLITWGISRFFNVWIFFRQERCRWKPAKRAERLFSQSPKILITRCCDSSSKLLRI